MMDNQCAIIFSTHATVYGSHNVMFAFIEKENIFLHVYPQLNFFQFGSCAFIFPRLLNFPQNCFSRNLFCFSNFCRGEFFFTFVVLRGSCIYFLLLCCVCLIFIELSLSIRYKKEEIQMKCGNMWKSYLFCLWGDTLIVYDSGKYKYVLIYLT